MASIEVTDNFYSVFAEVDPESTVKKGVSFRYKNNHDEYFKSSASAGLDTLLDVRSFNNIPESRIFSFISEQNKLDENELILAIQKSLNANGEEVWQAQSGNYIGSIQYKGHNITINPRFSESFLIRMMSAVNNVFLSDIEGQESTKTSYAEFILYFLFVQKLEKAFLLGLPKTYQKQNHHQPNVKGKVDIRRLINKDIPYKGKISSHRRERQVDQDIVVVLSKALDIVFKRYKSIGQNVRHVYTTIRQLNPEPFRKENLNQAQGSRALTNPIFAPFKEVLSLAELIIGGDSLQSSNKSKSQGVNFLVNIAELFELYVKSLLQKSFSDWSVTTPVIDVYGSQFFGRKIIPDIVMQRGNQVVVFDTKYKRMNYTSTAQDRYGMGDVDRSDFFQIHTYMNYYQSQPNIQLIGGGLLFPLAEGYEQEKCFSNAMFGNSDIWFCIDGIEMPSPMSDKKETMGLLIQNERKFIRRISDRLNE